MVQKHSGAPLGFLTKNFDFQSFFKQDCSHRAHFCDHFAFSMNTLSCLEQILWLIKFDISSDYSIF